MPSINSQKGFIAVIFLLTTLLLAGGIVGGAFYIRNNQQKTLNNSSKKVSEYTVGEKLLTKTITEATESQKPNLGNSVHEISNNKVDLSLVSVKVSKAPNMHDSYGMPILSSSEELEFTFTIRNIGNKSFKDVFYIRNSRTEEDFEMNGYSHEQVMNYLKKEIPMNGTYEEKFVDTIDPKTTHIRFNIDSEGRPASNKDPYPPKRIDELNYSNNTFELSLD